MWINSTFSKKRVNFGFLKERFQYGIKKLGGKTHFKNNSSQSFVKSFDPFGVESKIDDIKHF